MKRIFLGFLILLGIGLSGCASPKTIKNRTCLEKSTVIVIKSDGDSVLYNGDLVKGDTCLAMLLTPLPHDLASLTMIDGCNGIFFLKGGLDSATRKYTIIIQGDTIVIPETDSLRKSILENGRIIVGNDTILLSSPLISGDKDLPKCIIEGDKYVIGKDTFYMPKCENGVIIMNGDTIKIDELELKNKGHIKIIRIIENDSYKVKVEQNVQGSTDPQKEEL